MANETSKDAKNAKNAVSAENKAETVHESKKEQKTPQEAAYPVNELANNAKKLFGTRQECVVTALKTAGKTECTVTEAKEIVKKFLNREVE